MAALAGMSKEVAASSNGTIALVGGTLIDGSASARLTDVGPPSERSEFLGKLFTKELAIVGVLHRSGIPIVAGTDQPVPWAQPASRN